MSRSAVQTNVVLRRTSIFNKEFRSSNTRRGFTNGKKKRASAAGLLARLVDAQVTDSVSMPRQQYVKGVLANNSNMLQESNAAQVSLARFVIIAAKTEAHLDVNSRQQYEPRKQVVFLENIASAAQAYSITISSLVVVMKPVSSMKAQTCTITNSYD
ncbi:unnamed protein product [Phytophthora lilii]|uniref:Unnamed protein product n=1 Tax=Phytophthora lilii TaxID=2077276 RepID=A0A9W6WVX3_9STRA|nr:unnamed protein product [Phytophthora lilii]